MFEPIEFHDKKSLSANKLEPIILDPIRKGVIKLIRLKDEINVVHFNQDCSHLLFQHETDGKATNLLANLITDIPIGNRKDLVNSDFRDALLEEPSEEANKLLTENDYRGLRFIGESGGNIDQIDCPLGHFVFEACLSGSYKETPAREGLPTELMAKLCIYRNKEDEDIFLVIMELANSRNLEGGLIYVYSAREVKTEDIK